MKRTIFAFFLFLLLLVQTASSTNLVDVEKVAVVVEEKQDGKVAAEEIVSISIDEKSSSKEGGQQQQQVAKIAPSSAAENSPFLLETPQVSSPKYPENISDIYRGVWHVSPNSSLTSLSFLHGEGSVAFHLIATKRANSQFQTLQVEMVIRDGHYPTDHDLQTQLEGLYHTETGSIVLWSFLGDSLVPIQSFSFEPLNITAEEQRLDVTKQVPLVQNRMGFGTSSFCFLSARMQIDPSLALEAGETTDDPPPTPKGFGLISSPPCGLFVRLNVTAIDSEKYFKKAMHYTLLVSLISFIQMSLLVKQMEHSASQANASKVSLLTIGQQGVIDSYLCLIHLFTGVFVESLFTAFAATAFFKFIIFSLFEMRFLLLIWKARRPQSFQEGWEQTRRELGTLYSRFYGFLLGGVVLFWVFQSQLQIVLLCMYSFWIPQIVHNVQHAHRKPLQPVFVVGMSASRMIIPLYILVCPKNWLRMTPDPEFAMVLTGYMLLQVSILILQHFLGPRFFIPRKLIPRQYDYYRPIPTEMHEINPHSGHFDVDCVICMTTLTIPHSFAAGSGGSGVGGSGGYLSIFGGRRGRDAVVTPCDHVFHYDCLMQWIQIKMECPTCRRPIPDLVD